jgi:hypothetical protein
VLRLIPSGKKNLKMKLSKKNSVLDQVKASRKQSRSEEIQAHGKAIHYHKVMASKKKYNRRRKADDEDVF